MPKHKSKNTSTSSFGSPGREGHDSSAFYNGRLYTNQPHAESDAYVENPIDGVDIIFNRTSEEMKELPDCSVHLMVTSPPYNVGKDYDEDLSLEEYLAFLKQVWKETYRVLVSGGRACINVANVGRKPYIPLHAFIMRDIGCSLTLNNRAYSCASNHDGPSHGSPCPLVFSTSHGALLTTPTRKMPALRIASMRGLAPGAGTVWARVPIETPVSSSDAAMLTRCRRMDLPVFMGLSGATQSG